MAVLYRKYRPQTFAEVLGQKAIVQTLKNQVSGGSVAHAYLFTGSRGVGKTSVARILAKAVNCQGVGKREEGRGGTGDACGECSVCKQIEQGNFIDLVEIDAASNTGVDNIRDLIEHVKFAPSVGKYKVFIIDEVHMLSKGAFNALLKTLEEPPKHAIFILATTEINKVPATIISRTQRFEFKAYSASELLELLTKVCAEESLSLSPEVLDLIAQNAEGGARDALSLLGKVSTLGSDASLEDVRQLLGITDIATCENLLALIADGQISEVPGFFEQLFQTGADYIIFNRDFLEYLRKVLICKITEAKVDFVLSGEHNKKLLDFTEKLTVQDLVFVIRLFLKSYKDLSDSPQPQVPLLIASVEAGMRKSASQQNSGSTGQSVSRTVDQLVSKSANQQVVASSQQMVDGSKQSAVSSKQSAESKELKAENTKQAVTQNQPEELSTSADDMETLPMSLSEVEGVWLKIISKVKDLNGPLASLLRGSHLLNVSGNKIFVSAKFQFDKQNIESPKNASIISETIEKLTGKKMSVFAQVQKLQVQESNTAEVIGDVLKVFGGELVE